MLPRDETEDVLSGAVLPPGASFGPPTNPPTPTLERHHAFPRVSQSSDRLLLDQLDFSHHPSLPPPQQQQPPETRSSTASTGALALDTPPSQMVLSQPHLHQDTLVAEPAEEEVVQDSSDDALDEQQRNVEQPLLPTPDDLDQQWMQWEFEEEQRLIAQGGAGIQHDENGRPCPILPPPTEEMRGKKCLVLDLDETLVHSSFKLIAHADFIVPVEIDGGVDDVYVAKRPGVDEFLRRMGALFEIVVFTASLSKVCHMIPSLPFAFSLSF